jgi:hypothetical protein
MGAPIIVPGYRKLIAVPGEVYFVRDIQNEVVTRANVLIRQSSNRGVFIFNENDVERRDINEYEKCV